MKCTILQELWFVTLISINIARVYYKLNDKKKHNRITEIFQRSILLY